MMHLNEVSSSFPVYTAYMYKSSQIFQQKIIDIEKKHDTYIIVNKLVSIILKR